MARKRRSYAFPVPTHAVDTFKAQVMRNQGYNINPAQPEQVKFEVARTLGVPLQQGNNGHLRTEEAGRIGGQIGGAMVKEMIRMAQLSLAQKHDDTRMR